MINLRGDKYIVTGAGGFIGSHVAEQLVEQGKEVICIDNFIAGKRDNLEGWWNPKLCTLIEADVRHLENKIPKCFEGADAIFHLAASKCTVCRSNPARDLTVNAYGSLSVFEVARKLGAKVIHVSTGSVNSGRPVSFYGVSKMAGEGYLRAFKEYYPEFRYAALRVYHVYGPRQDDSDEGGVVPIFIRQAYHDMPMTIHGDGEQIRHFTYVKDVVNILFLLTLPNRFNNHHLDFLNDERTSIFQLAKEISILLGKDPHKFTYQEARQGDIRKFNVLSSRELPAPRTTLEQGLVQTIAWYVDKFESQKLKVVDGKQ